MRALVLCLALAACSPAIPDVTAEQLAEEQRPPARTAADNIAEIGAIALCDPGEAVTEDQGGIAVTYCEPVPAPVGRVILRAPAGE